MKRLTIIPIIVVGMSLTACNSDTSNDAEGTGADVATTLEDVATTAPDQTEAPLGDTAAAVANIQTEMLTLISHVQTSAATDELTQGVSDLQDLFNAAWIDLLGDGNLDAAAVRSQLESFGNDIEAAGDAVEPELRASWDSVRTQVEQLLASLG